MKKKIGLLLLVVAIVAVMAVPAEAGPYTDFAFGEGPYRVNYPNRYYYPNGYYPTVDPHRTYWDEDFADSVGKVITLPFTLPMRVKAEWERLDAKSAHWSKVGETYEKGFPSKTETTSDPEVRKLQDELQQLKRNIETQKEIKRIQQEIAEAKKELGKSKE